MEAMWAFSNRYHHQVSWDPLFLCSCTCPSSSDGDINFSVSSEVGNGNRGRERGIPPLRRIFPLLPFLRWPRAKQPHPPQPPPPWPHLPSGHWSPGCGHGGGGRRVWLLSPPPPPPPPRLRCRQRRAGLAALPPAPTGLSPRGRPFANARGRGRVVVRAVAAAAQCLLGVSPAAFAFRCNR